MIESKDCENLYLNQNQKPQLESCKSDHKRSSKIITKSPSPRHYSRSPVPIVTTEKPIFWSFFRSSMSRPLRRCQQSPGGGRVGLTRRRMPVLGSCRRLRGGCQSLLPSPSNRRTLLPVELLELVPLGADDNSLGVLAGLLDRLADGHVGLD